MSVVPRGDLQEVRGAAESGSADPRVGSQEAGESSSGDVSIGRVISAGSSSSGIDAREVRGCSRLLGCGDDLGVKAEGAARSAIMSQTQLAACRVQEPCCVGSAL